MDMVGWPSVGSAGTVRGRLGQLEGQLAPITNPNRHTTDPTDGQTTMSTLCPTILRVLNPFPALVCPSSDVLGPASGRQHGHLTWDTIPKWVKIRPPTDPN